MSEKYRLDVLPNQRYVQTWWRVMCKDCQNYKPIPHPLDQMISDYAGTHITLDDLNRFRYKCIKEALGWYDSDAPGSVDSWLKQYGHKDWIPK